MQKTNYQHNHFLGSLYKIISGPGRFFSGLKVFIFSHCCLQPILITTATTIVGLMPLWLFGGPMWEPMAIAIIFGLAFCTLLTLGVVPVLYAIFFRVKYKRTQRVLSKRVLSEKGGVRGLRLKAHEKSQTSSTISCVPPPPKKVCSKKWAELIKLIQEVTPSVPKMPARNEDCRYH